jgi:ABC-type lipoprotein export system ATPase subunit
MLRSSEALITLAGITKVFLTEEIETHALADVDLSIGRGDYVSIEGPSGCGKSTLLSILGLLDAPSGEPTCSTESRWLSCGPPRGRASAIAKWGSSFRPSI